MFDGKAFGQEVVAAVKAHVDRSLEPILKRLADLESRQPEKGEEGDRGKDGADGKDADPVSIDQVVAAIAAMPEAMDAAVQRYLEEVPPRAGKDGRDGVDGKDGADGKDADPVSIDQIAAAIAAMPEAMDAAVQRYLEEVPPPAGKDGRDGADGKDGDPGRDGLDVKDLFRADGGRLVAVMSDGTTKDLGVFVGRDGERGRDGEDGVGFDDMVCEVRDDGVYLVFEKGEIVKEARLPIPIDMGVHKADGAYLRGHCVTWGGSIWIAQKDEPRGKPDAPESDWRLAVKRGRDGKDAKP